MVLVMPAAASERANPAIVRALRIKDGYSIAGFAREIGITPGHLSNFEAGRDGVSLTVAKKMAETLGVPFSLLLLAEREFPERGAA